MNAKQMNSKSQQTKTARRSGFTLIELLVVIVLIAILAAFLLPTLSRAKASAKSAACKSNLRQIGIGLGLYVDEFQKYPLEESDAIENGQAVTFNWNNLVQPYSGGDYATTYRCPGRFGNSYYYNSFGSGFLNRGANDPGPMLGLGLLGFRNVPVPESRVLAPSDMVAVGDMWQWGIVGFGWPGTAYGDAGTSGSNHGDRRANAVFCDDHVESSNTDNESRRDQTDRIPKKPDGAHVRRWNNDNQPHPETWPGN